MSKFYSAVAALLLVTAAAAASADEAIEKPLVAQSLDGFHKEADTIRDGLKPGGRYEFVKAGDRERVEARLNSMEAVLQKNASKNDLNTADKIALANAQEEVNGILKHNDSNRLVCESRAPIGSNILRTTCHTHGQIEATARNTREGLMEFDHSRLCNGNPNNPCSPDMNHPNARGH